MRVGGPRAAPAIVLAALLCAGCGGDRNGSTAAGPSVAEARRTALVRAVELAGPSVVGIITIEDRPGISDQSWESLRRFFPDLPTQQGNRVSRIGSGIVLDSRGYFLTNHHLVGAAQQIWLYTPDGREFEAELVGSDPSYDLAVIRLTEEGAGTFETAPLNLDDDLMVGEWVLALGNPYGNLIEDTRPSVTVGVVSAVNRDVRISEGAAIYKNMIQTDASINPGNSGGPLVNAAGEVVGINTFIISQGAGSMGVGFSIPIQRAIEVAGELIQHGRVRGVWIGIAVQMLNRPLAKALATDDLRGLVVWSLEQGSPAERAGIRLGDIIRGINGKVVQNSEEARRSILAARVEETIVFTVERNRRLRDIPVTVEPLPTERGG